MTLDIVNLMENDLVFLAEFETFGFVSDPFIQTCLFSREIEDLHFCEETSTLSQQLFRSASGAATRGAGTLDRGTSAFFRGNSWLIHTT